jgi:hypothetical protein
LWLLKKLANFQIGFVVERREKRRRKEGERGRK